MPAAKLAAVFLFGSVALLLVVWASPLCNALGAAVAYVGSVVLRLAWGVPVEWLLTSGSTMGLGIPRPTSYFRADVAILPMVRNVPLFVASALTCGNWRARRTWSVVILGTIAVIVLDGIVLVAVTWPRLAEASGIPLTATYEIFAVAGMNFGTGGIMVAPIFLGAMAAWPQRARRNVDRVTTRSPLT